MRVNISKLRRKNLFLISDLHLNHTNIIEYCNRPFHSIKEMNYVLINNWNLTVKKKDIVYFLGDLASGREGKRTEYWLDKLNGTIIFVKGDHDNSRIIKFIDKLILIYKGHTFFLVHDPKDAPKDWKNWIIHGHRHNHDLENFPFINGKNKTINVSAELLNYKPLNIDELIKLDFEKIIKMETIDSKPLPSIFSPSNSFK